MTLPALYVASLIGLLALLVVTGLLAYRRRSFRRFKTAELATLALLICLLYVAAIPWQIGLAKVPGVDALVFSIPYTTVLLLGLRLVPKPGAATVLVCGAGLFGQLLGRGLNPAWCPYYLWCGLSLDLYLLIAGHALASFRAMLGAAVLRGLLAYSYMYLILAPFLWQQFYAWWYVCLKVSLGVVGCTVGAWLAWRLAPAIERATRYAAP